MTASCTASLSVSGSLGATSSSVPRSHSSQDFRDDADHLFLWDPRVLNFPQAPSKLGDDTRFKESTPLVGSQRAGKQGPPELPVIPQLYVPH